MSEAISSKLNNMLRARFGLEVDFDCEVSDLRSVMEHYMAKRERLIKDEGTSAIVESAEYTKAFLISEAVRMFLREIAPRRMKKRKMEQK